jgi:hypothetical protein
LEGGAMVIQIPGNEHFVREPFHRWHSRVLIEALITFRCIPQTGLETVGPPPQTPHFPRPTRGLLRARYTPTGPCGVRPLTTSRWAANCPIVNTRFLELLDPAGPIYNMGSFSYLNFSIPTLLILSSTDRQVADLRVSSL